MAVYYKFKSAKDYDSIPIDGHFIAVANLKEKIFDSKHLGRGTDFDLVVTNAQTNEEYLDEAMLIPKNTSVLIRRVPGQPRLRILTAPVSEQDETMVDYNKPEDVQPAKSSFLGADPSIPKYPDDSEWDEFGNDLYAIPDVLPVQSSNPVLDAPPPSKADEDSKIKALIDTPALDWQHQPSDSFGLGRGFGRGMGGRMMGGRGFGRGGGLERKTPPQGYICHRCKVPGHFIQHCPTNGDPNFDVKRVKPPTGIPKSMLMATPDGSYALPSGAVAVLKPNEAAFEKEIEGMPSSRPIGEFPPELRCPLCKEGMKDAVLTSKCCFNSFCDKCIRDYIISKSACVCGATNILADDLLPNKTLRDTINRLLESNNNNSSAENGGSAFHVQDMESARCPQPKIPSPAQSASSKGETGKISASKGEPGPTQNEDTTNIRETLERDKAVVVNAPQQGLEKREREVKAAEISEATHESRSVKEPASHGSAPMADEEVQQKALSSEAGKKKKKKKVRVPISGAEMQWRNSQEFAAENYMMPMGPPPPPYNPFWNGMQGGMEGYLGGPYPGPMPPYMGFGFGPMDLPFGGVLPPDPFAAQGYMMPPFIPPQRDFGMGLNGMGLNSGPPIMSREEFEARKADLKRKREIERRGRSGREFPNDREFSREMSSTGDISSMKLKSKSNIPPPSRAAEQRHRSERPSPEPPRTSSKRKSDYDDDVPDYQRDRQHHHPHHRSELSATARPPVEQPPSKSAAAAAAAAAANADRKSKASVFSRISFPEREETSSVGGSKKRKIGSSSEPPADVDHHSHRALANGYREEHHKSRKSAAVVEYESSDEDRHFKRRPSRYESSPPAPVEEGGRHSRGSRDRVREERDRSGHGKHR